MPEKLKIGISSCLLGNEVRFDGGHKRDRLLENLFADRVEWKPVCPEVGIGLGTPRESLRLIGQGETTRLVAPRSGSDHTESMRSWSREKISEIESWNLDGFILKRASPSCGLHRVKVYTQEHGMPQRDGRGIFADELARHFPLMALEEEGRLHDDALRERFVERLYTSARWRSFLRKDPTPRGLVRFHTIHKMVLMAHNPESYRQLGRLVAEAGRAAWKPLLAAYAEGFAQAQERLVSRGRHVNVLHHLMGFLKHHLERIEKVKMLSVIDDFQHGFVPLSVPLTLLGYHLHIQPVPPWVHQQVYLNPYPKEMMLRNH